MKKKSENYRSMVDLYSNKNHESYYSRQQQAFDRKSKNLYCSRHKSYCFIRKERISTVDQMKMESEFQFRNLAINRASHSVQRQRGKTATKISAYSTLQLNFQFLKFLYISEHKKCLLFSSEHTIKCSSQFSLDYLAHSVALVSEPR